MAFEAIEGAVVAQRYRLERPLGEGGMGEVWEATHTGTRKAVALKILKASAAANPDVLRRFLREARAASAVRHPNVVQIHDIVQTDEGLPILVMDLLEGESLRERLSRERTIALPDLATILVPVISAVGAAHTVGIVHRDLKPDNIFLARLHGGKIEPMVLDFGIAKLSAMEGDANETGAMTKTGSMLGTPYYMSPEQVFGEKNVDARADVWAMGIILYECLAGRRPVEGENFGQLFKAIATGESVPLRRVAPELPGDVLDLVDKMLMSDRGARLASLHHADEVLRRYTDASAPPFSAALRDAPLTDRSPSSLGSDAFARTTLAPPVSAGAARANTDAFARTTVASPAPRRSRATWVLVPLIVASSIAGGFVALRRDDASPATIRAASPTTSPSVLVASAPAPETPPPPASVATAAASAAASSARPSTRLASPVPASSAPAEVKPAPPSPKPKLPGNMPEAAPF